MGLDKLADEFPPLDRHQQSRFRVVDPEEFVSGQGFLGTGEQETFNVIQPGGRRLQKFFQFCIGKIVLQPRNFRAFRFGLRSNFLDAVALHFLSSSQSRQHAAVTIRMWCSINLNCDLAGCDLRDSILLPHRITKGGDVEFVMFEDVYGQEVFVNPKRVIWVREYADQKTVISCGAEDKFTVRLTPAQAVAALGMKVR